VKEAQKLGIPVFAICDTNSNPELVQFPIPANDDASKSIQLIVGVIGKAIEDGLSERKVDKEDADKKQAEEEGIQEKQTADE
jgi:small subunit ribosomal protein S2